MENLTSFLNNLQKEQEDLYNIKFPLIIHEIRFITSKIKECNEFSEAVPYFETLSQITTTLILLLRKYYVIMPAPLLKFVRDFTPDWNRQDMFDLIKSGRFQI